MIWYGLTLLILFCFFEIVFRYPIQIDKTYFGIEESDKENEK